jgi:hypothetical protein
VCDTPVVARLATPVTVVGALFGAFKILQFAVFVGWCYVLGDGRLGLGQPGAGPLALASVLVVGGQILNLGVFSSMLRFESRTISRAEQPATSRDLGRKGDRARTRVAVSPAETPCPDKRTP